MAGIDQFCDNRRLGWRGHQQQPTRFENSRAFLHRLGGIRKVLDDMRRKNHIEPLLGDGKLFRFDIDFRVIIFESFTASHPGILIL